MTKLYNIDVRICGTAYIRADNESEAVSVLHAFLTLNSTLDVRGKSISSRMFDDPALPKCSLSPAMTIDGIWPGAELGEVY